MKEIRIDYRIRIEDEQLTNPDILSVFELNQKDSLKDMFKENSFVKSAYTQVTLHDYPSGNKISHAPNYLSPREDESYNEELANKRMDIIGRNGNTGEHYEEAE
jgi:hypothetical protein